MGEIATQMTGKEPRLDMRDQTKGDRVLERAMPHRSGLPLLILREDRPPTRLVQMDSSPG